MTHTRSVYILALCLVVLGARSATAQDPAPVASPTAESLPKYAKATMGGGPFFARQHIWALGPANQLLSASENGYIWLWNNETQQPSWQIDLDDRQVAAAIALINADEAIAVLNTGAVLVIKLKDGTVSRSFSLGLPAAHALLSKHMAHAVVAGNTLVVAAHTGEEGKGFVGTWSLSDGTPGKRVDVQGVSEVALSPDGTHAAWATINDFCDQQCESALYMAPISDLAHPAKLLTRGDSPSYEEDFFRYDTTFNNHPDRLIFSPDGASLAYVSTTGTFLWTISGGKATKKHTAPKPKPTQAMIEEDEYIEHHEPMPMGAVFSSDSKQLWASIAFASEMARVLDIVGPINLTYDVSSAEPVAPSPNGSWAFNPTSAVVGASLEAPLRNQRTISFASRSFPAREPLQQLWGPEGFAISPDGTHAATTTATYVGDGYTQELTLILSPDQPPFELRDAGTRPIIWRAHDRLLTFDNPFGNHVEQEGTVFVWLFPFKPAGSPPDPTAPAPTPPTKPIKRLPIDPVLVAGRLSNGQFIACSEDGKLHKLNKDFSLDSSVTLQAKPHDGTCPRDTQISESRVVINNSVADLASGDVLVEVPHSAILSPDGKYAAFSDENDGLVIVDIDKKTNTTLKAPGSPERFSPDSKAFVLKNDNTFTLCVISPDKGCANDLTPIQGHTWPIVLTSFSEDGKTFATIEEFGKIYTWDWPAIVADVTKK